MFDHIGWVRGFSNDSLPPSQSPGSQRPLRPGRKEPARVAPQRCSHHPRAALQMSWSCFCVSKLHVRLDLQQSTSSHHGRDTQVLMTGQENPDPLSDPAGFLEGSPDLTLREEPCSWTVKWWVWKWVWELGEELRLLLFARWEAEVFRDIGLDCELWNWGAICFPGPLDGI